jgi:hypothetical protein
LQDFLAGRMVAGYRPPVDRYRPPRRIPPAYPPPVNELFCRSFSLPAVAAVGAGGILTSFTGTSATWQTSSHLRLNPQEALHGCRQFRYLIVGILPIPDGLPDAMLDMVLQQDDRDLL